MTKMVTTPVMFAERATWSWFGAGIAWGSLNLGHIFFNLNFVQLSTIDYFLPKIVNCCTIKYCILCSGGRGFSERVLNSTEIYNYFAVLAKNI